MQRFLAIRLSSIGDIVHTLPAVAALGETFPEAEIHWVVESRHARLLEGNPFVHRTVTLDTLGWRKRLRRAQTLEDVVRCILTLREVDYDASIDFQGLYKSAFVAKLSRSRERVGFADPWLREPGVGMFYTEHVSPRGREHVIEMNMALVEHLGAHSVHRQFPLPRTAEDDRYIHEELASHAITEFVVINPGGGWKSKCWSPENYAELIVRLEREFSWNILLTGSPEEEPLIRGILEAAKPRRTAYVATRIVQLIALARRAKLFVGGDTGPVHLAAAVGTPVVALYSADRRNTPARNGPFRAEDIALLGDSLADDARRSKNGSYLSGIPVERVCVAVRQRLDKTHG